MSVFEPHILLRDGIAIPRIGLGLFRTPSGAETRRVVRDAISVGYRHFDTARIYGNEADVAEAIRESGIGRASVFVTSKVWNEDQGYEETLRACEQSLARMRLEQLDLLLLHWPVPGRRRDAWRALERLRSEGRVRAIGVSNFMPHHLRELLAVCKEAPAVNQVELTPFLQHRELRALCDAHEVRIEAYSPLTKGARLAHPTVVAIADETGCTAAQVLLCWGLQRGLVVLPKSTRPERLAENLAAARFALGASALARLDALEEGLVTGWDPRNAP